MAEDSVDRRPTNLNDVQSVEQPNSPASSPDEQDGADLRLSRKREREVSIEPQTPKPDDGSEDKAERPKPVPKKNRTTLDATVEEDETPPQSPRTKAALLAELSTSPPHETKVRQIQQRVRGLTLPHGDIAQDTEEPMDVGSPNVPFDPPEAAPPNAGNEAHDDKNASPADHSQDIDIPHVDDLPAHPEPHPVSQSTIATTPPHTQPDAEEVIIDHPITTESDPEDQEKNLKRKMGDRVVSSGPEISQAAEPTKRARDAPENDENPRERKRPTPPPESRQQDASSSKTSSEPGQEGEAATSEPQAEQSKLGGFLSYASTSSPFAKTAGPSVFGKSSSTSPPPFQGSTTLAAPQPLTAFASPTPNSPFSTPSTGSPSAGFKRSGFEAFASNSSPFASMARSKSPVGSSLRNGSASSFVRSKSPPRSRALGTTNAFKSYTGTSSPFAVPSPPVKKQRQDQSSESESGDTDKRASTSKLNNDVQNGGSAEGSDEESDKQATFADRLRAQKSDDESAGDMDEGAHRNLSEQEVMTGEEDEETLFQVRGKLYALSKQNQWQEKGTGLLKLNVRRSDGAGARLVMRKEAVFALLLNVPLFKGMRFSSSQDPRYVRFSAIEAGTTVHYNLRLANAKVANELLEEIGANLPRDSEQSNV